MLRDRSSSCPVVGAEPAGKFLPAGATRRDRTGDLLITKNMLRLQPLHWLYTDVPDITNLGKLHSLKQQLLKVRNAPIRRRRVHRGGLPERAVRIVRQSFPQGRSCQ